MWELDHSLKVCQSFQEISITFWLVWSSTLGPLEAPVLGSNMPPQMIMVMVTGMVCKNQLKRDQSLSSQSLQGSRYVLHGSLSNINIFRTDFSDEATDLPLHRIILTGVSTGPGPSPGPLWSNIASFQSRNIFLDQTRFMCSICFVVRCCFCLFHINCTSHRPQKNKSNWRYC